MYALLDAAGVVRYVGQSADSRARVARHWADARRYPEDERPHVIWLRSLDGPPAVKVLDRVPVGDTDEAEAAWIRKLRRDPTAALFNLRPYEPLDGLPGVDPAAVARLPVSLARPMSSEHRAAISSALRGHPVSVETRRRISEAKAGQPHTPAHRAAIAAGVRRALARQLDTSSAS
ncbi:NUMOD3 domain-containing DNA-binding protein [Streptomyces sp. NPDC004232]|uniref:NUMOD3 domain-containing DNA-binding protein n=1 Tax=Streptomyces sp. NPDC004232 TaxID=3154454 RepID=UPI0033A2B3FF